MTVIIGFIDKSKAYIGGDRLSSNNYLKGDIAYPKVFKKGLFLFGYTTSFRFGEILEYNFKPPLHPIKMNDREYMISLFIPRLRKCLEDNKYSEDNHNGKSGTAIIAYQGKIYTLQEDWSLIEYLSGIHTTGSGAEYAAGAMSVLKDLDMCAEDKIRKAIRITSEHCPSVSSMSDVVQE